MSIVILFPQENATKSLCAPSNELSPLYTTIYF